MTFQIPNALIGTALNDTLTGTAGTDLLYGLAGNDSLTAGAGDDWIWSGAGTNRIDAGDGNDWMVIDPLASNTQSGSWFQPANGIDGGTGYDTLIFSGNAADYHVVNIVGGTLQITDLTTGAQTQAIHVEHLQFADGDIFLSAPPAGWRFGTAAADVLSGTSAADTLMGQGGDDALSGGGGADSLDGGTGADRIQAGAGDDAVRLGAGDLSAAGGTGNDLLILTQAANVILSAADQTSGDSASVTGFEHVDASALTTGIAMTGSAAANLLIGGQGGDVIQGGKGADTLAGGLGGDTFVFTAQADSPTATPDQIADFTPGQDRIDLSLIDAVKGGGNDAFTFVGSAAFSAAGQLRYDAATGLLQGDVTGDGQADIAVILTGAPALALGDLIL